jgi:hypothetical protein
VPLYDSAGLLSLFRQKSRRPTGDVTLTDPIVYTYLSYAQEQVLRRVAIFAPQANYSGLVQLTTPDGGTTYNFGNDVDGNKIFPFGQVELRNGQRGRPLMPGADWQMDRDYVHEGDTIRFPGGKAKVFNNGLYARFCKRPPEITSGVQPTLKPIEARICIVDVALLEWATQVGAVDPEPFEAMLNKHWAGDPSEGDFGLIGMLKEQYAFSGVEAVGRPSGAWWYGIDDGSGYQPIR